MKPCGRLLLAGIILGAILVGCARKEAAKMETELEMQNVVDLGVILDTTAPVELFLPVKNRSNRTINIHRVTKDCSCTSVSIDRTKLAPGETAKLRVSTNLSGKTKQYLGNIVIQSDAVEKIDEIQVQGIITGQIRIRPSNTTLILGDKYEPGIFTVFCEDETGKWRYDGYTSEDPNVTLDWAPKSTSPTTSTYEGAVRIAPEARSQYKDFGRAWLTLKFTNEKLGKQLEIKRGIDLAIRRRLTTDPSQVTFLNSSKDQKRIVLVQSGDPIEIDSATCNSAAIKPTLQRIDSKTVLVQLAFLPSLAGGALPQNLACELHSGGKILASIPINVVNLP